MSIVTLTTDFGYSDSYAGVMKGVMLKINRELEFVDITHAISPHDIQQAAYVLYSAFSYFPEGAIHLCVVDPGVGSNRRPIAFEAGGYYFAGPDNGVFTKVIEKLGPSFIYEITNPDFINRSVSNTFHGRDIFAPTAAWIARGGFAMNALGPQIVDPTLIDLPKQTQSAPNLIEGRIIYIDHFGNAVTNITSGLIEKLQKELGAEGVEIEFPSGVIKGILKNYSESPGGAAICATIGSQDTLEFFVRSGSASATYGLSVNDDVDVRFY
ncbi:MAG TPA: hypothetical protein ENI77_03540 [Nitrospirae bacterium]|nr:hypothetical protein [Nitrospirota bacterium]